MSKYRRRVVRDVSDAFDYRQLSDPYRVERAYEGIERRVLAFTDELSLVHYTVESGAEFPAHEHEETHQSVYVIDGEVELFGDRSKTLTAGDTFIVGPGERHGIRGVATESRLIDAFSPPIERYVSNDE